MTSEHRSRVVTEGIERAPNRSMLRAVGFTDADFAKPIVGIANGYSNLTPCNVGIGALAARAEEALRAAGTMPQVFGTITVSDGISMGTEGMKYSLVSREVIADSIETVCNAQAMDGVLAIGGCDKNMPGAAIAFARLDIPAVFVYAGTIKPGHHAGEDLTIVSVFEALGRHVAGRLPPEQLLEIERKACPGPGACGGMFTANTMSSALEAMGLSLPGSSTMAAEDAEKAESAAQSARVLAEAIRQGITARGLVTREAFENAIAVVMAVGGSTNAVLHLLAIAHAAKVPLALDDFETVRARVPVLCELKPSGRFVTTDFHRAVGGAGGDPALVAAPLPAGAPRDSPRQPRPRGGGGEDHRRQAAEDHGARARLRLRGGLHQGHLRRGNQGRRRGGDPLRGPQGRPGHARDAVADLGHHRRRARRLRRPHHRRSLLRRHVRHGRRARGAGGGGGRHARPRTRGRHDHDRRRGAPAAVRGGRGRDLPPPGRLGAAPAALHSGRARHICAAPPPPSPRRGDGPRPGLIRGSATSARRHEGDRLLISKRLMCRAGALTRARDALTLSAST